MKISIKITDEQLSQPGNEYSPKKTITYVDIEEMDATPRVIAATLKGAADEIFPPKNQIYAGTINGSTLTTTGGVTFQ